MEPTRPLSKPEIAACRTTLGALQWLAIQTQPQLCARCNLLLTEVVTSGTIETAKEIQQMLSEVRADPYNLEFFKLPGTKKWTDVVFVSMGDQSHSNRPQGDSTGGLLTLAAGPDVQSGRVILMNLLAWRSWKLKGKPSVATMPRFKVSWKLKTKTSESECCGVTFMELVCTDLNVEPTL